MFFRKKKEPTQMTDEQFEQTEQLSYECKGVVAPQPVEEEYPWDDIGLLPRQEEG